MSSASFTFHGSLNYFLPRAQRNTRINHRFKWRASIKDMIESLGPPHPEVGTLVVNQQAVNFDYIVQPGDVIDVYDCEGCVDLPRQVLLRPAFPGRPRFVLDTHLGRLASYLRMMGFDTLYRNDYPDDELAYVSNMEERILLSRDIGLLKRSLVVYGYFIRATNPRRRVTEVMERYDLRAMMQPFKHCMKCNGTLNRVEKSSVLAEISTTTAEHYNVFHRCSNCDRVYWKGSHYAKMQHFLDELIAD